MAQPVLCCSLWLASEPHWLLCRALGLCQDLPFPRQAIGYDLISLGPDCKAKVASLGMHSVCL